MSGRAPRRRQSDRVGAFGGAAVAGIALTGAAAFLPWARNSYGLGESSASLLPLADLAWLALAAAATLAAGVPATVMQSRPWMLAAESFAAALAASWWLAATEAAAAAAGQPGSGLSLALPVVGFAGLGVLLQLGWLAWLTAAFARRNRTGTLVTVASGFVVAEIVIIAVVAVG